MGQAKNEMMRRQDLEAQGMSALVKAGAVEECEFHEGIFIDQGDPDAVKRAYAIGTNMVKAEEVDGTREEFMAAITSALQNAGDECPNCAKLRRD
jgi:hypothetical protein